MDANQFRNVVFWIFALVNMDVHPPNVRKMVLTHPQIRTHPGAETV